LAKRCSTDTSGISATVGEKSRPETIFSDGVSEARQVRLNPRLRKRPSFSASRVRNEASSVSFSNAWLFTAISRPRISGEMPANAYPDCWTKCCRGWSCSG